MEKLTWLLNEWSKTALENKCTWVDMYDEDWVYFLDLFNRKMTMEMEDVISKRNWFIKWLVKNDKIDTRNLPPIKIDYDSPRYIQDDEEILLMLLSISNSPIKDLILYLK